MASTKSRYALFVEVPPLRGGETYKKGVIPIHTIDAEYLYTHPAAYRYLILHFLPDLSEPEFQRYAAAEMEEDERRCCCRNMAAWLPYEKHYAEILKHIAL